jgi:2-polyprenyl-3-methyl-5-hydroxy-6-metoxy-1,4-benzoquinol methylase
MNHGFNNAVFINEQDELGNFINTKANELYSGLKNLHDHSFEKNSHVNEYFIHHHLGSRLFFSIQNSAHILYDAIKISGKQIHDITAIDYGAGLGTLFMLGGMLGFKRFDYNDYLPEWHQTAKTICRQINSDVQSFIEGDIDEVIDYAAEKKIKYDIVVSRNVIEHIYSLPNFYAALHHHNPKAVVYSTTTANYQNLIMRWYHIYIHNKYRKNYLEHRIKGIKRMQPSLSVEQIKNIATSTRGKGQADFIDAVNTLINGGKISKDKSLRSNDCDCETGVWNEHLLTRKEYGRIIENAGFKMMYTAGYWDTHYNSSIKNLTGNVFNKLISIAGKKQGAFFSPFINVIAYN